VRNADPAEVSALPAAVPQLWSLLLAQAHDGAGVLRPLAQHMANLALQHLQGLDSSQALDIASVSWVLHPRCMATLCGA
jgi:hypothetical protein